MIPGAQFFQMEHAVTNLSTPHVTVSATVNSDNPTDVDEVKEIVSSDIFSYIIVSSVVCLIVAISAVVNLLVILVIANTRRLHRMNNVLIVSLAVADTLRSVIVMPTFVVITLGSAASSSTSSPSLFSSFSWLCPFYDALLTSADLAVAYGCVLVGAERAFVISKPLVYQRIVTPLKMIILVTSLWAFCALYGGLQTLWYNNNNGDIPAPGTQSDDKPSQANKSEDASVNCLSTLPGVAYATFDFAFSFCVPLVVLILSYVRISLVVRSQMKRIAPVHAQNTTTQSDTNYVCYVTSDASAAADSGGWSQCSGNTRETVVSSSTATLHGNDQEDPALPNRAGALITLGSRDMQTPRVGAGLLGMVVEPALQRIQEDVESIDINADRAEDNGPLPGSVNNIMSSETFGNGSEIGRRSSLKRTHFTEFPILAPVHASNTSTLSSSLVSSTTNTVSPDRQRRRRSSVTFDLSNLNDRGPTDVEVSNAVDFTHQQKQQQLHQGQRGRSAWMTTSHGAATSGSTGSSASTHQSRSCDHASSMTSRSDSCSSSGTFARRRSNGSDSVVIELNRNKAFKMTLIVVSTFVAGWLPVKLCRLLLVAMTPSPITFLTLQVVQIIAFLISAVNPFVYNFYSAEFRRAVKRVVTCNTDKPDMPWF